MKSKNCSVLNFIYKSITFRARNTRVFFYRLLWEFNLPLTVPTYNKSRLILTFFARNTPGWRIDF